jgi:hypothetical protein
MRPRAFGTNTYGELPMGMWGYLHRVPSARLAELLAKPSEIMGELYPEDDVQRLPKLTWDAIEFILGRLADAGRIPPVWPVVGGGETGTGFHYGPCWFRTPAEVQRIADVLGRLSKDEFKRAYLPEQMASEQVYPDIWDRTDEAEANFEYVWSWYAGMIEFYQAAADSGEGMLLHLG